MSKEIPYLDLRFKGQNASFRPGDVISGVALMEIGKECTVKTIKVVVKGTSLVSWQERRAYTKGSSSSVSHRNCEVHLNQSLILAKIDSNMTIGRYEWPFSLSLPPILPASFESQFGRVQYQASLVAERAWCKTDAEFQRTFNVLGHLDLNADATARCPAENAAEMQTGSLCRKTGTISAHLSVPRRGCIPGDAVGFLARVVNRSSKRASIKAAVCQLATFRADREVRKAQVVIKEVLHEGVRAGETISWEGEISNLPRTPPSHLGCGCKHIDVKYHLKLMVICGSGPGEQVLEVPVELIIGTKSLGGRLESLSNVMSSLNRAESVSEQRRNTLVKPL